jgi:Protein of unknown function (DUF4231)
MRPALIRRLPRLGYDPPATPPLVPPDARAAYPELAADLGVVDDVVQPALAQLDREALTAQNRHRLLRVAILVGAMTATLLGLWQTAADGAEVPAVAGGLVSAAVAFLSSLLRRSRVHRRFLQARLGAERLRSECFLFLARTSGYEAGDAVATLQGRVAAIERESVPR